MWGPKMFLEKYGLRNRQEHTLMIQSCNGFKSHSLNWLKNSKLEVIYLLGVGAFHLFSVQSYS